MPKDQDNHVEAYLKAIERRAASVPDYRIALGLAAYRLAVYLSGEGSEAAAPVQHYAERLLRPATAISALDDNHLYGRLAHLMMDPENSENPDLRERLEAVSKEMLNPQEHAPYDAAVH